MPSPHRSVSLVKGSVETFAPHGKCKNMTLHIPRPVVDSSGSLIRLIRWTMPAAVNLLPGLDLEYCVGNRRG